MKWFDNTALTIVIIGAVTRYYRRRKLASYRGVQI